MKLGSKENFVNDDGAAVKNLRRWMKRDEAWRSVEGA